MTLVISHDKLGNDMSPWEKNGVSEQDYILGEELGLIAQRNQVGDDYEEMIGFEEEFQEEIEEFVNELERAESDQLFEREVIFKDHVYENIDVRLVFKNENFGIGSIDGVKNVFVPKSLMNNISTGEIAKMNLIYKPTEKNAWKAVYIHRKVDPYVKASFTNKNDTQMNILEVPTQDLGKMIGKNGFNINKIRNDIIHNNQEMSHVWEEKKFPAVDISNEDDCTMIKLWEKDETDYDMVQGFVKKMYC